MPPLAPVTRAVPGMADVAGMSACYRKSARGDASSDGSISVLPLAGPPRTSRMRPERAHPMTRYSFVVIIGLALGSAATAFAQGTSADYARANGLRAKYEAAAGEIAGPATAIGRTHRFWYRKNVPGGDQFMLIDADTLQKQPLFDHDKMARSLSEVAGKPYK